MKAQYKKAWVDALRSGEWISDPCTYINMEEEDDVPNKKGCVLCVLANVTAFPEAKTSIDGVFDGYMLFYLADKLGSTRSELFSIEMLYNNYREAWGEKRQDSFYKIADWIEANVSTDIEDDGAPPAPISANSLQSLMERTAKQPVTV